MGQVTIKDLAKALGLSPSTISRALHGHHAISADTISKVKALAADLDYQPNILAFNLKKQKTNTIGMVVPDLAHHYFANIISGAQEILYDRGYQLLICQSNDDEKREIQVLNTLIANRIDGLLISIAKNMSDPSRFYKLSERKIPLVFFDRIFEPFTDINPTVTINDYHGALIGTNELIKLGCQNMSIISSSNLLNIGKERLRGFLDALKLKNIKIDTSNIYESDLTIENSKIITYQLLAQKDRPDGIMITSGLATIGCLMALKEKGFTPGKEIKVAGFLSELYPGHKEPGLIRIQPPSFEIGRKAAMMLLDKIATPAKELLRQQLDVTIHFD